MTNPERGTPATSGEQTSAELDIVRRRELMHRAVDTVSDLLETTVTVQGLRRVRGSREASPEERLIAERSLRAIAGVAVPNSEIMTAVGERGLDDYVEAVVSFGADEKKFVALVQRYGLEASEVTGLYALRDIVSAHAAGRSVGLDKIVEALASVGFSIQEAALDPEAAAAAFDERGYFTDHDRFVGRNGKVMYRQHYTTRFDTYHGEPPERLLDDDPDGSMTREMLELQREELRLHPEEVEGETIGRTRDVSDILREITGR